MRHLQAVFIRRALAVPCNNTIVLDLGAHRGYFGSYALVHGAKQVYSFEPFQENYEALVVARNTFGEVRGCPGHLEKCAVCRLRWSCQPKTSRRIRGATRSNGPPASGEVVDAVQVPVRSLCVRARRCEKLASDRHVVCKDKC